MSWPTWIGIALCLTHSAMFSGLNLGMLGSSRLRLQVAARGGNVGAQRILALREDFNLLLTTILWGNVAVNTLLAILADSILTGVAAFVISTVAITIFGEIFPQAYISRHAHLVGGALAPVIRVYRVILMPVAWPTARLLDRLVGKEGPGLFHEGDLRELLHLHIQASDSDLSHVEGHGALNFLALDDRSIEEESEAVHPDSILSIPFEADGPRFPAFEARESDPFLRAVDRSQRKWIVITDDRGHPRLVLNANRFLRSTLMDRTRVDPIDFCHEPFIVADPKTRLEIILDAMQFRAQRPGGRALHPQIVLLWTTDVKRVLTGVDLLENLLRGLAADSPR